MTTLQQKQTYSQDWANYNASQTREKYYFVLLLKDLCNLIEEHTHKIGRKPKQLRDVIYSLCLKTYLNTSSRRLQSDLKLSREAGYLDQHISFNTLLEHMERQEVGSILKKLIEISALPLKEIESSFAVDATGFGTTTYTRWFDVRIGKDNRIKLFRKCHAVCGVSTNVITSVDISAGTDHDISYFEKMVRDTAKNFSVREVLADKGYLSKKNYNLVRDLGGIAYIPFKSNNTGRSRRDGDSFTWRKMFAYFRDNKEQFMARYGKRQNIESAFSSIKRKFGNNLKCKKEISQDNEILAKVLCYNICVLIQEVFINNIEFDFRAKEILLKN